MADPEEARAALERADEAARARAQAALEGQDSETILESLDEFIGSFGIGANRGLANMLGLPSDVLNFLFSMGGINTEPVFGSSRTVAEGMSRIGVLTDLEQAEQATGRLPGDLTESLANRVSSRIGEEIGAAVVPAGAVSRAGQAGIGLSGPLAPIMQGAREAPQAFAIAEGVAALGGGIGAATAQEIFPDSPLAEAGGQLAGGLGFSALGPALRAGRSGLNFATEAGRQRVAAERVQDITSLPREEAINRLEVDSILREQLPADETIRRLEEQGLVRNTLGESAGDRPPEEVLALIREEVASIPGATFTSAQITNDPGLLALERGISRKNAELVGEFQDITSQQNQAARAAIREATGGQTESQAIADFIQGRADTLNRQIDARTASAVATARSRIENISPTASAEEAATIVRQEIEAGFSNARTTERALWQSIYSGRTVGTQPIKSSVAQIRALANKVDSPENIPRLLDERGNDVIKALAGAEDVDTILSLRSRILEAKRAAQAADVPNRALIKNLDVLQEASLRSLGLLEGQATTQGGAQIRAALDFSRHLNDVFTRGPVGRVLGFERRGGQRVADIETLDRLFRPGRAGGTAADAIVGALTSQLGGGDIEGGTRLIEGVRNFVFNEFITSTHGSSGAFDPGTAQRFLIRYGPALDRFPGIKSQLEEATRSGNLAQIFERSGRRLQATLADTRRSRAAVFLDRDVPQAIRATFTSRKPALAMRELVRQARRDATGEALEGLKQGVSDHLFDQVKIARLDLGGDPMLSAKAFRDFLGRNEKTLSALYSPAEMGRLRQVQTALNTAERSITSSIAGGSDTAQNVNVLVEGVMRILGATAGSRATTAVGGQALIGAGAGSRAVRQFFFGVPEQMIEEMIQRAVFDPDLMKTLLAVPTKKTTQQIVRRLHGHLLNLQLPPLETGGSQTSLPSDEEPLP